MREVESPGPPEGPGVYLHLHSRATLVKAMPVSPISAWRCVLLLVVVVLPMGAKAVVLERVVSSSRAA